MGRERPNGTVTFLFTEIEESTRRPEDAVTDMAAAVQAHDAMVRDAIESRSGYVFATDGDRFSAVFSTATDAVTAAVAAQQLLAEAAIPFGVRMGLHTGEATEREGGYFGTDANRAARLMSLAHGGQIVVSDTTEVLLRQRVALRPLGEHRLRGLRGRMTVYQVIADGFRSEFPVLRSVDRFAGNLPQQLSSFVGREDLVTEIAQLLQSDRLVTLSGVRGVGKTRLALEVGLYGCLDYYRDVKDPFSTELVNRYDALFPGSAMFTAGSACSGMYRGLKLWEAAVNEAGSLDQADVIGALDQARIAQGPGGPAEMVPGQHHVRMNMYIARSEGGTFKVVKNLGRIDPNEGQVGL